jgi:hypothetical protein
MHSGHMLREGTWPDHVRFNIGSRQCPRDPDYLRQELVGRALEGAHRHIPWLPAFAIALSVQSASLDICLASARTVTGRT